MNSAYEWLYTHYCKPMGKRAEFLRPWAVEAAGNARALLLSGEGDQLDRLDAIDTLETAAALYSKPRIHIQHSLLLFKEGGLDIIGSISQCQAIH